MRGLVSCTGAQFCGVAMIETKNRAMAIVEKLEAQLDLPKKVRMHWTGCPNSCGQVWAAFCDNEPLALRLPSHMRRCSCRRIETAVQGCLLLGLLTAYHMNQLSREAMGHKQYCSHVRDEQTWICSMLHHRLWRAPDLKLSVSRRHKWVTLG